MQEQRGLRGPFRLPRRIFAEELVPVQVGQLALQQQPAQHDAGRGGVKILGVGDLERAEPARGGIGDAELEGDEAFAGVQAVEAQAAASGETVGELTVEAQVIGSLEDGGALAALPAGSLEGKAGIERRAGFAGVNAQCHLAEEAEALPAAAEVGAQFRAEAGVDLFPRAAEADAALADDAAGTDREAERRPNGLDRGGAVGAEELEIEPIPVAQAAEILAEGPPGDGAGADGIEALGALFLEKAEAAGAGVVAQRQEGEPAITAARLIHPKSNDSRDLGRRRPEGAERGAALPALGHPVVAEQGAIGVLGGKRVPGGAQAEEVAPGTDVFYNRCDMALALPTFDDVRAARQRISDRIARTPVLHSRSLDERAGCEVYAKGENFQRAGAFKFRGATNRLLQLTEEERKRGVLAFSSGNHAQAVALAARDLGIRAALVMPTDAPKAKLDAVRAFGGEVHLYDRATVNREAFAAELVKRENRVLVPPFDDARIIAGAGTAALELLEAVPDLEALVVPVGGGGLISGSALAAHGLNPRIQVFGVEPATAADVKLSLERGVITPIADNPTIADGLRTVQPGELTFAIMREHLARVVTVTDAQLIEALKLLLFRLKVLVEPSGCAAVAALIRGAVPRFKKVGVILSGGNMDASALAGFLRDSEAAPTSR